MWIFCAGMKQSGSTLQYQLASHLVERAGLGSRVGWSPEAEFPAVRRARAGSRERHVLKCHQCTPQIAAELIDGGARGFFTFRDLRDVIASQMLFLGVSFESLWSRGFLQECVEEDQAWGALPGIAMTEYETMIGDLTGNVRRLASHLEISVDDDAAAGIAREYTLEKQRVRIECAASWERVSHLDGELVFDPHTLLHRNHLNSGRAGAWAEILSDEQRRRVEG